MGYGSDADVMFVCEPKDGTDETRAVKWSVTVAEQVRSLLGTPSADPPPQVDMNLRPEGRQGTGANVCPRTRPTTKQWAQAWRSRLCCGRTASPGDEDLGQRFLLMVDNTRYPEGGVGPGGSGDPADQGPCRRRTPPARSRSEYAHSAAAAWPMEWTVQLLQLRHAHQVPALHNTSTLQALDAIDTAELIEHDDVERLREAWLTATRARNALVLVRGRPTDQLPGPGRQLTVAVAAGWPVDDGGEFLDHHLRVTRRAKAVVLKVFEADVKRSETGWDWDVVSAEEHDRLEGLYAPLAQAVRNLIAATAQTGVDEATLRAAQAAIEEVTETLKAGRMTDRARCCTNPRAARCC